MEKFRIELIKFLKNLGSYVFALSRLIIWTILTFFSGLQRILFTRSEVIGVELKIMPLRCDLADTEEKLAYIDKLCMENPELITTNMYDDFSDDIPFDKFDEDE